MRQEYSSLNVLIKFLVASFLSVLSLDVSADIDLFGSGSNEPAVKHVKNSYIVAFKPPELGEAPFIQVPEKKDYWV